MRSGFKAKTVMSELSQNCGGRKPAIVSCLLVWISILGLCSYRTSRKNELGGMCPWGAIRCNRRTSIPFWVFVVPGTCSSGCAVPRVELGEQVEYIVPVHVCTLYGMRVITCRRAVYFLATSALRPMVSDTELRLWPAISTAFCTSHGHPTPTFTFRVVLVGGDSHRIACECARGIR